MSKKLVFIALLAWTVTSVLLQIPSSATAAPLTFSSNVAVLSEIGVEQQLLSSASTQSERDSSSSPSSSSSSSTHPHISSSLSSSPSSSHSTLTTHHHTPQHTPPHATSLTASSTSSSSSLSSSSSSSVRPPARSYDWELLSATIEGVDYRLFSDYRLGRSTINALSTAKTDTASMDRNTVQFQRISIVAPLFQSTAINSSLAEDYVSFSCVPKTHTGQPLLLRRHGHNRALLPVFYLRHTRHRVFCAQFRNVQAEDFTFQTRNPLAGSPRFFASYTGIVDPHNPSYDFSSLYLSIQAHTLHVRLASVAELTSSWGTPISGLSAASFKVSRIRSNALPNTSKKHRVHGGPTLIPALPTQRYPTPHPTRPHPHHDNTNHIKKTTPTRPFFHIITPPPPKHHRPAPTVSLKPNHLNYNQHHHGSINQYKRDLHAAGTELPLLQDSGIDLALSAFSSSSLPPPPPVAEIRSVQLQLSLRSSSPIPHLVSTTYVPLNSMSTSSSSSSSASQRFCTRVGLDYVSIDYHPTPQLLSLSLYRDAECTNQQFQASLQNGETAAFRVALFTLALSSSSAPNTGSATKLVSALPITRVSSNQLESTFTSLNSVAVDLCVSSSSSSCNERVTLGRVAVEKQEVTVEKLQGSATAALTEEQHAGGNKKPMNKKSKISSSMLTPPVCTQIIPADAHHRYPLYVRARSYFRRGGGSTAESRGEEEAMFIENNAALYTNDKCSGSVAYLSGGAGAREWQVTLSVGETTQHLRFSLSHEMPTKVGTVLATPDLQ